MHLSGRSKKILIEVYDTSILVVLLSGTVEHSTLGSVFALFLSILPGPS
jgi:hypothetical protein